MNQYVLCCTTLDRKIQDKNKKNYLQQTIENLVAVGGLDYSGLQKLIIADSGSPDKSFLQFIYPLAEKYRGKILLLHENGRLTANENVSRVIRYASEISNGYVMYFQDDTIFRPHFMENVDAFVTKYPNYPMHTFHGVYDEIFRNAKKGKDIWNYAYGDFYGSLCYVLKKNIASRWANHLQWVYETTRDPIGADLYLGKFLKKEFPNQYIACSCPSFVQHIGKSSIIAKGNRPIINQSFNPYFLTIQNKKYYEMIDDIVWDGKGNGKFIWK